jgi:hypothetical protein
MWHFRYSDLSNSDSVTLVIHKSHRSAERIVVDSLPVDPKGKVIRSLHHCFDGMENLREVIFKDSVDLKNIDDTRCMFNKCRKLERVVFPANAFPYIYDCSYMFQSCPMLKEIIAPNLFISPYTNLLSDSLRMFNEILNETPVDVYNVPRSVNWLVELDAIKRGVN